MLKSKLKRVIVTNADHEYEGSLTLDPALMEAADLLPYERVEVNGVYKEHRLVTYVIPGDHMSGQVEMNGGMANFFKKGDEIHVNCYVLSENGLRHKPTVVITDKRNIITEIR